MKKIFLIIIIVSAINCFPKGISDLYPANHVVISDSTSNEESLNLSESPKLKIINPFYFDSPMFLQNEILFSDFYIDYSSQNNIPEDIPLSQLQSFNQSKLQLNKAMQIQYGFMREKELGTFGKILGRAVGVTALGLGVYHLIKYKDEYFK